MDSVQPTPESHEALWAGLPTSNLFKQKKLTGLREAVEGSAGHAAHERRTRALDAGAYAKLRAFLAERNVEFDVVALAAYHLLLQWYLDDVETLIGSWLLAPSAGSAVLRPSYIYSEDEDPVDSLLRDVGQQIRGERALHLEPAGPAVWDAKRAPVFYYAGLDGMGASDAVVAGLDAMRFPERRVIVAAAASGERAEFVISMPAEVAGAIGIDDFQQRFDTLLAMLVGNGAASVGDLKAQLGATADVPYRQLQEMQRRVIALWARVLGIPESTLSETSSYFEVGGTSLNAFKLVNRVRIEFQRDLSMRDIIENPTVQEFSRLLLRS